VTHRNGEAGDAALTAPTGQDGLRNEQPTNTKTRPNATTLIGVAAELWPIFAANSWDVHQALAVGVDKQLLATGCFKTWEIGLLLHAYTRRRCYQVALGNGGQRFNLDGSVAGPVGAEHVEAARAALEAIDAKQLERIAAHQADRARRKQEREDDQARAGREFVERRRATQRATGRRFDKVPRPQSQSEKIAAQPSMAATPPGPPKLGLADLKAAFRARQAGEP
jgi:hypothetical protein